MNQTYLLKLFFTSPLPGSGPPYLLKWGASFRHHWSTTPPQMSNIFSTIGIEAPNPLKWAICLPPLALRHHTPLKWAIISLHTGMSHHYWAKPHTVYPNMFLYFLSFFQVAILPDWKRCWLWRLRSGSRLPLKFLGRLFCQLILQMLFKNNLHHLFFIRRFLSPC